MNKLLKLNPAVRYYWRHVCKYPTMLIGTIISVPVTVLINVYLPALVLANVLSRLATHDYVPGQLWDSFGLQLVTFAGLLVAGMACWRIVDFFMWRLEMYVQRDIAEEVFDHMLNETSDFHANNFTGSLVSQTNKLLGGYVRTADTTIFQVYPMLAGILIVSAILINKSPLFVVALLIFSASYLLFSIKVAKPVQRKNAMYAAAESKQTGFLADAITNVMAIKSFSRGQYEKQRFTKATKNTQSKLRDVARAHTRQINTLGGFTRLISSSSLLIAVISVMYFNVDIGTVFLIFNYTGGIVNELFQFSNSSLRNYNRALGDAADMVNTLAVTPKVLDPINPEPAKISRGVIEFKDVRFTHSGANEAIFKNLNIRIKQGEKIGLVGHSGSGKTTLTRLLLRFSDIDSGEILIDGQNIARVTQDDLHEKIAYVPQEPLLFHRTIAENIGYGRLDADQKTIKAVAKMAHADAFVSALPNGYDTLVGERGVKLSGGQRQRVAIARAMLKNAPILVLDEATSALDSESEALIQDALWKLMEGRTAIVIAHRLSTIQRMDRIVVLEDGEVIEQGSHKELLQQKGTYAELWQHQSGGFLED